MKSLCYPRGFTNTDTLRTTRELFEVGMNSDYGYVNRSPIDTYFVGHELVDMYSQSQLESKVGAIIQYGGWVVFYTHTGQFPTNQDKFFALMDYVATKDIDVVTVDDAMKFMQTL